MQKYRYLKENIHVNKYMLLENGYIFKYNNAAFKSVNPSMSADAMVAAKTSPITNK